MAIQREIIFKADDSQFTSIVDRIGKTISDSFGKASGSIDESNQRLSTFTKSIQSELEKVQQSGRNVFSSMLQSSEKYSGNIKERLNYLQRELQLQEKLVREDRERERLSAKMGHEAKKASLADMGAGEKQFREADDEYSERITRIDADEKIRSLQMSSARTEYEKYRAAELEKDADSDDEDGKSSKKGRNGINRAGAAVGGAFNAALGAAGFGAVLSIAGFVGKAISEGEQLSKATGSFRGLSNRGTAGVGSMYDLKTADSLQYAEELAKSSGSINGIARKTREQYSFEKAYSLNAGEMNAMGGALRMDVKGRSSSDVGLEMLNFFKQSKVFGIDKGDFTRVSELLTLNNEMNAQQVEQLDRIDPTQSSNLMKMFGKMGIDSSRITSYSSNLNQGITNPKDEFSQAIIYRALRQKNPNMSLFQLQEQQEQGIYGKGNLSAVMDQFGQTSSGEMLMKNVASAFGLKNFQARKLVESYEKDNNIFNTEEGMGIARDITKSDVQGRAAGNTTTLETLLVRFNDKFAGWGKEMLDKLGEYVKAYDKDGFSGLLIKIGKDLTDAVVSGFNKVYDSIRGVDVVTGEEERAMKSKGLSTNFVTSAFDNASDRKKKFDIKNASFRKNINSSDDTLNDGVWMPGGKMLQSMEARNAFSDNATYSYHNYDHVKGLDKGKRFSVRGNQEELEKTLKGMTRGEHEQMLNMKGDVLGNYDGRDGKRDGELTVKALQQMLAELRKLNQKSGASNSRNTTKIK